jgi:hypothetical protein
VLQRYFKLLVLLGILHVGILHAQNSYFVNYTVDGKNNTWLNNLVKSNKNRVDSINILLKNQTLLIELARLSYLNANINSINFKDSVCAIDIHLGASFKWIKLSKGNVSSDVLTASGFRENQFYNTTFHYTAYVQRIEKMLQYLEQNGYPFAQLKLDSILVDSQSIAAQLQLDKGDLITFDTVEIIGDANVKSWFIGKYLGIKKSGLYNESLLKAADSRLSQLPFLQTQRPTTVYFVGNIAKPVVYATNRKSSSVDGLIGFAPSSDNNSNKLLLTGEANLKLQNLFGSGKSFDLSFKSFLSGSQELKTKIVWPYILKSNVGVEYELNLLKFDSTFLDVKNDFGIQYRLIGNDYVKVFYSIQTTSLITVDTNEIKLTQSLPQANDLKNNSYGLGTKITRYDYFFNPRKGYSIESTAAIGFKNILKNPTIQDIKFAQADGSLKSIYDTMQLSSVQYRFYFKGDVFIPITQRFVSRIEAHAGHIETQSLFISELFRIGGLKTLKGFDEQAIFANSYGIITTEIRYLLQQNSNVMLFWNGAWYENAVRQPVITDTPYGFGAGLNFETGAGIFSLYYAVGKQFNNPIELNKAKIHFGFVNYF